VTENPSRLLVVDDDFNNRDMLSRRLARRGYSVDVAEGGREALNKILREPYDLVLLDQMMPGMSGLDLLRLLRATYSPSELPVIMVTAVDQSQTMVEALDHGANDYVVKPIDMPVVTARIEAQLARSHADRQVRKSEERYSLAERGSTDGLWDWDPVAGTMYFSAQWAAILGYSQDELRHDPEEWLSRLHPDDEARVRQELRVYVEGGALEFRSEHRLRQKNGEYRWVLSRGGAVRGSDGRATRVTGSLTDIENSKVSDPLTGLSNRLMVLDRTAAALVRTGGGETRLAVLLMDLDGFKVVNDSFGHAAGDNLLTEVAARLRIVVGASRFAGNATIARIGGDEFVVLIEDYRDGAEVTALAGEVLACLRPPASIYGLPVTASASVGIVLAGAGATPGQLLRDADLAMYRAKELGKNRWHMFEPGLRERAENRMALAIDLRHAVERNELVAVYQPKMHLRTRTIVGFEALMRWRHPERGLLEPRHFIPIAEETGLIIPAGEWILDRACRQLRDWQEKFPLAPPLTMSVNLSVRQLGDPNLLNAVQRALSGTGIPPESLKLELTESSLIAEIESARTVLTAIQALRVGLKLDDFGTGYSSLSYLSSLHFDSLKIDRSFVDKVATDQESQAIVQTIVSLANALRMGVVAEGIETEPQLQRLIDLGCEAGQGYYFSVPVEAELAERMLRENVSASPRSEPALRV
jgi:diguanylate cyclase (GGDEF)-like protein/PAS domain S-box-containing protein